MPCNKYLPVSLLTGALILFAAGALADWQPNQQPETTAVLQSPFSLEDTPLSSPGQPPHTTSTTSTTSNNDSPFALPSKSKKLPEKYDTHTDSPFALPSAEKSTSQEEDFADKVFEEDSRSAAELLKEGMKLARAGMLDEARIALANSIQKEPENVIALNNLGLVLRKLGRLDDALNAYQYALQVDGTFALTYKNLGVLLENKGEKERAVHAYMEYCRLSPGANDIQNVKARAEWLRKKL